jgi:hypothetical protein
MPDLRNAKESVASCGSKAQDHKWFTMIDHPHRPMLAVECINCAADGYVADLVDQERSFVRLVIRADRKMHWEHSSREHMGTWPAR